VTKTETDGWKNVLTDRVVEARYTSHCITSWRENLALGWFTSTQCSTTKQNDCWMYSVLEVSVTNYSDPLTVAHAITPKHVKFAAQLIQ